MKYLILLASITVQICLGGLYAWSAFVPVLADYGLSKAQTQLVFGVLIGMFTITMVFAGKVLEIRGPRQLLVLSGLLFALGYGVASFSGGAFIWLLLGIGVIVGAATGIGYVCPLSVCMRWFPTHKGLVTGVAVAGFGGGAVLLANVVEPLLENAVDVFLIFRGIGLIYGAMVLLAGLIVSFPPEESNEHVAQTVLSSDSTLQRDPFFWALTCALFSGTFAGLLVIGNLKPIALASGLNHSVAALGISTFAIGNAAGRIAWGRVVDRLQTRAISGSLVFLALTLLGLWLMASYSVPYMVVTFLVGFGFGACFVVYASLVAGHYGVQQFGHIYPKVFLAYGAAGIIGPATGGWLYDLTLSYSPAIGVSMGIIIAGLMLSIRFLRLSEEAVPDSLPMLY